MKQDGSLQKDGAVGELLSCFSSFFIAFMIQQSHAKWVNKNDSFAQLIEKLESILKSNLAIIRFPIYAISTHHQILMIGDSRQIFLAN